jgi:hypothetical protein
MTRVPSVQPIMQRALLPVLLTALALAATVVSGSVQNEPAVNRQAAAMQEFEQRLNEYLKLRSELASKLRPLAPTGNAADLATRQAAIAAALRTARKSARQGDLVPAAVAAQIAKACTEDFHFRNPDVRQATLQEVPNAPRPLINKTFPESEALPTVPPLLLSKLPRLPDNLQYRFYGRNIVLLDGDTQLIIDYVPNVLPPH